MEVSLNGGTPKSPILIGFSIINHPFLGTPIFGNTLMITIGYENLTTEVTNPWMDPPRWEKNDSSAVEACLPFIKMFVYVMDGKHSGVFFYKRF